MNRHALTTHATHTTLTTATRRLALLAATLLSLFTFHSSLFADSPAPTLTIPAFDLAPLAVTPAALAAITTEKYPDADAVTVDSLTTIRYAADGTNRVHDDTIVKILTEKGLRESRTWSSEYLAFYDDMRITLAQIIHPDGTTTPIDIAANSKQMIDPNQMGENIYDPNDKILTLALPGLKVGDAYQIIFERDEKRPIIKGVFSDYQDFESTSPILHYTYEIRGPKTTPLRSIALLDPVAGTITDTQRDIANPDGTTDTLHTWEARDVPQYFYEPSMLYPCTQRLLVSTAANWQEISKWYAAISEPHLAPTPEIRAKVAELISPPAPATITTETLGNAGVPPADESRPDSRPTDSRPLPPTASSMQGAGRTLSAGGTPALPETPATATSAATPATTATTTTTNPLAPLTDDEKIRAIFKFVSQEIRYMGITLETDDPGYEPHDVSLTYNNRYGVCRDKAALLVTMLRCAGYDASPVLINAGPLVDKQVPFTRFNHAITAIRRPDGAYQLLDSTNESTIDLFPPYLANRSYLVARPEGETLRVSPVADPERNLLRATTTLTIADDATVTGSTTLDFAGINDTAYRQYFAQQKPEDIRRYLETIIKNLLPGATLAAHEITPRDMLDTATPLRLAMTYTAPDYLAVSGDKTLLTPPWLGANFSIAARILGEGAGLAKRRFPLEIPITCGVDETIRINLSPRVGATLALPDPTHLDLPALTYDKTYTRDAQTLTARLSLRLRAPRVDAGDAYAVLKNALKDIEYAARQKPILAAQSSTTELAPDTRTLADTLHITLADAHNWTRTRQVTREILTYAGKKTNAELRVDYNPAWETVTLDHATVTLKDGATRAVNPTEINIMDAPWVASAPRYPAGKTLVVSLPGVEIGSTIDYQITSIAKDRPWFYLDQNFFSFDPVDHYTFTLDAPGNVNLKLNSALIFKDTNDVNPGRHDPAIPYHIVVTGSQSAHPRENALPPAIYLDDVYEYEATTLNATVTTSDPFASSIALNTLSAAEADNLIDTTNNAIFAAQATDYAALINAAIAPLATPDATIASKAAEITAAANAKTETERLIAIRDYVARNIRHAGPNFLSLPLANLTPAAKTLADAYGNQADRSILLAALLKAAGMKPEFVLAAPPDARLRQPVAGSLFDPNLYSALIVRATTDKRLVYLDQLSIYAEPGATAYDNCPAIPLATGAIETIHALDSPRKDLYLHAPNETSIYFGAVDYKNIARTDTYITIAPNGDARIAITETYKGTNHTAFKNRFAEMPPEQRDREHQTLLAALSQSATPDGDLVTNYDYPGTLKYAANIPRYAVRTGDYLYFQLPGAITAPTPAAADTRLYPLYIPAPVDIERHWNIQLPADAEVQSIPENITWTGPGNYGAVEVKTINTGRSLLITETIHLLPAVIPAADYTSLLEINRRLSQPAQWRVLLKTK